MWKFLTPRQVPGGQAIIIVSGLPRSGTSMMMKMLAAGGVPVMTDSVRTADENNPKGYFEYEAVKEMGDGDTSWMEAALGKALKVISYLLDKMPSGYPYKVIFMQREIAEVLASQKRMLEREGKPDDRVSDDEMQALYSKHLENVMAWLSRQPNMEVHFTSYNEILNDPRPKVEALRSFLGMELDAQAMVNVVDKALYRERSHDMEEN
jgi:hypothetical protein